MNQNIAKLNSVGFFDIKPGLERITKVLNHLDNPQDKIAYVLIAGTNGKGSVASILSGILTYNGYKTGLYTSPHLVSVTERIKVDGNNIPEEKLDEALGMVFEASDNTKIELSYFELVTAAAFLYFEREWIDIGILEVGMGGRWDATNVVTPMLSVITNISLDHTRHLGATTEMISKEKAEIIKENIPVVCGAGRDNINHFIKKATETKSDLYLLDRDFSCSKSDNGRFNYSGIEIETKGLSTNLPGPHQVINCCLSLACSEIINKTSDVDLDFKSINTPINAVDLKGRFEIVNVNPTVILDCAHNEGSAIALTDTLYEFCPHQKYILLLSMVSDKDHDSFIRTVSKEARKIVITKIPNARGSETDVLFNISKKYLDDVEIIEDYKDAYEYVKGLNKPVCVTGSIYLVGAVKEYLSNKDSVEV